MSFWTKSRTSPKLKHRFIVKISNDLVLPNILAVTKPSLVIENKSYLLLNNYFNYPGPVKWNPIRLTLVDGRGESLTNREPSNDVKPKFKEVLTNAGKNKNQMPDTAALLFTMLNNTGYAFPRVQTHQIAAYGGGKSSLTTTEKSSTLANSFGLGIQGKLQLMGGSISTSTSKSIDAKQKQSIQIYQLSAGSSNSQSGFKGMEVVEKWVIVNPIIKSINWGELDYRSDELVEYTLEVDYDWAEHHIGSPGETVAVGRDMTTWNYLNSLYKKSGGIYND